MTRQLTLPLAALGVALVSALTPGFSSATYTATSANTAVLQSGTWTPPCQALDVQANVGDGRIGSGDTITLTYAGDVRTSSLIPGWTGASTEVLVRLGADDVATVHAPAAPHAALALGQVRLGADFVKTQSDYPGATATTVVSGTGPTTRTTITLRLGAEPPGHNTRINQVTTAGTLGWTPPSAAADTAGAACSTSGAGESGAVDRDF